MNGNFTTLVDFAQEVERVEKSAEDYIVPSSKVRMVDDGHLDFAKDVYGITPVAHSQIASKLGIPGDYYNRIQVVPGLRAYNVNALFEQEGEKVRRLIRTVDGNVRAMLSDRYKPIDNGFILRALFPAIQDAKQDRDVVVKTTGLSSTKMYLQILFPQITKEVLPGDVVQAGVTISNSEVGLGTFEVRGFLNRLICSNGLIGESVVSKKHVGRRFGEDEGDYINYARDTIESELSTYRLVLRDTFRNVLTSTWLDTQTKAIQKAVGDQIKKPEAVVTRVVKHFGLPEKTTDDILHNMVQGRDLSRWGLVNGITALAHGLEDCDKQFEVEVIGRKLLDISDKDWTILTDVEVLN